MQEVNGQWDQTPPRGSPHSLSEDPLSDLGDERPIRGSRNLQVHMLALSPSLSVSESSVIVQEQGGAPADGGSMVTRPRSHSPSLTSREGSVTGRIETVEEPTQSRVGSGCIQHGATGVGSRISINQP